MADNERTSDTTDTEVKSKTDRFIGLVIPLVLLGVYVAQSLFTESGGSQALLIALVIFGLVAATNRFDGAIAKGIEKLPGG